MNAATNTKPALVSGNLMTAFKLITCLTFLFLFSCKTRKQEVISNWNNGKVKVERIYSDTPDCFIERNYYENGQLASETKFMGSIKNGESVAYYNDGKLLGKCVYKNGKINGEVTEFHKTGNLMFKGNQVDGNLVGIATHYYENGKPKIEYLYKDKQRLVIRQWDSSGKQLSTQGLK